MARPHIASHNEQVRKWVWVTVARRMVSPGHAACTVTRRCFMTGRPGRRTIISPAEWPDEGPRCHAFIHLRRRPGGGPSFWPPRRFSLKPSENRAPTLSPISPAAVRALLDGHGSPQPLCATAEGRAIWTAVQAFYAARADQPVWFEGTALTPAGQRLVAALRAAGETASIRADTSR